MKQRANNGEGMDGWLWESSESSYSLTLAATEKSASSEAEAICRAAIGVFCVQTPVT